MRWLLPVLTFLLGCPTPAYPSLVSDWHDALVAADAKGAPGVNFSRSAAILHLAMFDAGNAVLRRYVSYFPQPEARSPASAQAAAAAAAHAVLARLYPAQAASFEEGLNRDLQSIADPLARDNGLAIGRRVADRLLSERADDGWSAPPRYRQDAVAAPGRYRATKPPVLSQLPAARPFALASASQFRPGPPPALDTAEWIRARDEVHARGGQASAQRLPPETELARFIAVSHTKFHLNPVAVALSTRKLPWLEQSRLMALLAMASADAVIASFDAKYHYLFWRPETALGEGWAPLVDTPPHPEYPCNHCVQAGVVAEFLGTFHSRQPLALAYRNPAFSPDPRLYDDPDALVAAAVEGRVAGGVHYRFSGVAGAQLGREVARLVFREQLRPVP
jgi:hypothetical protein